MADDPTAASGPTSRLSDDVTNGSVARELQIVPALLIMQELAQMLSLETRRSWPGRGAVSASVLISRP